MQWAGPVVHIRAQAAARHEGLAREVIAFVGNQWEAAQTYVPVQPFRQMARRPKDHVHSHCLFKDRHLRAVHLLQGNDVGVHFPQDIDDSVQPACAVETTCLVDVVGHHSDAS